MSIIGTRPPLISETNFYELHHRATVTAQNKEELQLVMFPNLKITFEELFDLGEY